MYNLTGLAAYVGRGKSTIGMALKRRQLIKDKNGYINTDNATNAKQIKLWLQENSAKKAKKASKPTAKSRKTTPKPAETSKTEPETGAKLPETDREKLIALAASVGGFDVDLNEEKKKAEIEYKKAQTRLVEIKEAKMRGETIPFKLVAEVFSAFGHTMQTSYYNKALAYLDELAHKTGMSREDKAKAKGRLVDFVNEAHKSAVDEGKASIKAIRDQSRETENSDPVEDDSE